MQTPDGSIDGFLNALAAKAPTPGGGSVTALVGALAAAMGEMVLAYSVDKKDLLPHQPQLRKAAIELNNARRMLLQLMIDDQQAYADLSEVKKLPREDPTRADKLVAAAEACISIPQAMGATAVAVLRVCNPLVEISNRWLLSDLAVCADLATATARCAISNVRVNLPSIENAQQRERFASESQLIQQHAVDLVKNIIPRIWTVIEGH